MNQVQVNYKIFLCAAGYEPEIRRITIDKDISHNYFYLKQKLISIFPTLKDVQFTISWKDREGDTVRICTDEELVIALREMEGQDFKKIYVSTNPQQGSEGPIHPNVFCDGCNSLIQGFRYKCIVCPDFDLCPDCERAQNHPDHPMIRIPLPLSPEMPFSRRFGRDLHKMSKHLDHLFRQSEKWWGCDNKGRGDHSGKPPTVHWTQGGRKHKACPFGSYVAPPENLMKAFSELMYSYFTEAPESGERAPPNPTAEQPSPSASDQPRSNFEEQRKFVEILRQGLSSFIDPLGADIPTSQEGAGSRAAPTPNESCPPSTAQQTENAAAAPEPSCPQPHPQPQKRNINEERPMDLDAGGDSGAPKEVRFASPSGVIPRERVETPVLDVTWTVINSCESAPEAEAQSPPPTAGAATATSVNPGPEPGKIYPAIPVMPIGPSGDVQMNLIDSTMERMLSLGFTDEGGWLRQLVESKDGNLEEVLRFLSPIPRSVPKKK